MSIGVPIKLLHEAENHVVTVELKSGELYRGYLMEAEDTMNMRLDDVYVTRRDGKQLHFDQVFVRGSQVRFVIIPDMLKNSPMFKRISNQAKKGKNASTQITQHIESNNVIIHCAFVMPNLPYSLCNPYPRFNIFLKYLFLVRTYFLFGTSRICILKRNNKVSLLTEKLKS